MERFEMPRQFEVLSPNPLSQYRNQLYGCLR